jgi:hypothetical protein
MNSAFINTSLKIIKIGFRVTQFGVGIGLVLGGTACFTFGGQMVSLKGGSNSNAFAAGFMGIVLFIFGGFCVVGGGLSIVNSLDFPWLFSNFASPVLKLLTPK